MWVEDYLGLPHKNLGFDRDGVSCYGLVRLVLGERSGNWFPTYKGEGKRSILRHSQTYKRVSLEEAKELDVAIMLSEFLDNGNWIMAPIHMGIFITSKFILHVNVSHSSRIDCLDDLRIHEVIRVV